MTKDEVRAMMKYFNSVYKNFYEGANIGDVLEIWADFFKDENKDLVAMACKNYVRSNQYPPTIAGIMEQMRLLKEKETDTDLWAMIQKAARNGTYGAEEEFNKLPPECQSFIGNPSTLKELAQIDSNTMNTIVKGQFLKRVEAIKEHQEVQRGLPAEVRQAIEASKMKMLQEGETTWD